MRRSRQSSYPNWRPLNWWDRLSWKECEGCHEEFRKEPGWKIGPFVSQGGGTYCRFRCRSCKPSEAQIDEKREKTLRPGLSDVFQDVEKFQREVVCTPYVDRPRWTDEIQLAMHLIQEEVQKELFEAVEQKDIVEVADAIADSMYVLLQLAYVLGIRMRPIWDEVTATNMAKKNGPRRADGKILKPEGWRPPDVIGLLRQQGWNG